MMKISESISELNCKKIQFSLCIFLLAALERAFECVVPRFFTIYIGSGSTVTAILNTVILISLGLGFYFGNRKNLSENSFLTLPIAMLLGAVSVALVPVCEVFFFRYAMKFFFKHNVIISTAGALLLAAPSSFIFAFIVSKIISEKDLSETDQSTQTKLGKIILLLVGGRIFGAISAGFLLLPKLGTKISTLVIALILLLMSFICGKFSKKRFHLIVMSIILLSFDGSRYLFHIWNPAVYADFDSEYARMQLTQLHTYENNKFHRTIGIRSDGGTESFAGNHDRTFIAKYNYYYDLPKYYFKNYEKCLLIGGAAYTYPTYFYDQPENLNIEMDVVEIDPKMTEIAKKYFGLRSTLEKIGARNSLKIFHEDGRYYLNSCNSAKYDAILLDAFKGEDVPLHLVTSQAIQQMNRILKTDGVVIVNVISALKGKDSELVGRVYAAFQQCFETVKLFQVHSRVPYTALQNLMIVAIKGKTDPEPSKQESMHKMLSSEIEFHTQFAPIDDEFI